MKWKKRHTCIKKICIACILFFCMWFKCGFYWILNAFPLELTFSVTFGQTIQPETVVNIDFVFFSLVIPENLVDLVKLVQMAELFHHKTTTADKFHSVL